MRNYIVHDAGGNILRTGVCPDDMLASEAGENQTVIEGVASDKRHIVVNGKIREKPVDVDALKAEVQERFRLTRNARLASTDWTQLPDSPLANDEVMAWREYRQLLRDLPAQSDTIWPTAPGE